MTGDDLSTLIQRADTALMVAKGDWSSPLAPPGGRNRVVQWKTEFPVKK